MGDKAIFEITINTLIKACKIIHLLLIYKKTINFKKVLNCIDKNMKNHYYFFLQIFRSNKNLVQINKGAK